MEDGQVLVMGGLRKKEIRITRDQVPLLGDLPLIGFLFANNKEEIQHTELVVFISPHIYKGEPMSEDEMAKFKEISERPMLSLPGDSKISLRTPTNAEQKKNNVEQEKKNVERKENNIEQKKKQSSKQKYPTSVE
jgi:type II secretory pathway component GspD/PulD (secretin)